MRVTKALLQQRVANLRTRGVSIRIDYLVAPRYSDEDTLVDFTDAEGRALVSPLSHQQAWIWLDGFYAGLHRVNELDVGDAT